MFKSNDKTERITIRLTKQQMEFVNEISETYNFSTSDYLRMLINHQMFIVSKKKEIEKNADK